jgi:hypothetical protein
LHSFSYRLVGNNIETYSLGKGSGDISVCQRNGVPALAKGNNVTFLKLETRRTMGGNVLVALLETVVLGDVVEIILPDDDGAVHFSRLQVR